MGHGTQMDKNLNDHNEKPSTTLPGVVQKIIKSPHPSVPEKAEIEVKGADDLYREIRVANALTDKDGDKVRLKEGAEVDVTIEADKKIRLNIDRVQNITRCEFPRAAWQGWSRTPKARMNRCDVG